MTAPTASARIRDLMLLLGPQALAELARPLTGDELALVDQALVERGGDPAAAAGVHDQRAAAVIREHLPQEVWS